MNNGGRSYRTIRLCVDSYEQGVPTGRFYDPRAGGDGQSFRSLAQFLVKAERMLDEADPPQAERAKRAFKALPPRNSGPGEASSQTGRRATFLIGVMFRQHASWQGTVTWLEGNGEESFRSTLELLLLIDSALGGAGSG